MWYTLKKASRELQWSCPASPRRRNRGCWGKTARLAGELENKNSENLRLVSGMPPEAPQLPDKLQDWVNPFQWGRPLIPVRP